VLNLTIDVEYGSLAFVDFKVKTNFEIIFIDHINLKHLIFFLVRANILGLTWIRPRTYRLYGLTN